MTSTDPQTGKEVRDRYGQWVCPVIDHRRCQNVLKTSGTHSPATSLLLPHFDFICDLLLNRWSATWNLFVKYQNLWNSNGEAKILIGNSERVIKSTVFFFNFRKQSNFTVGWHLSSSTIMFPSASSLTRGATVVLASASSTPCTSLLFCCWFVLVGDLLSASWLFAVLVSPAGSLFLKWTDETVTLSFKYFKENCYRSHKLLNNRPFQVF